ncbi:uncharacterized protein B0I36DRAFT_359926 [Microdochium trichocladiopsis]|uniref:Uncharacterized protein n=1 Tax=Microdochium trichocladiopsis TaxID=1682393 RepID=A0A9P9BSX9_9PEZI|nr:uncharacterized protein B0I36DRAFT_359926 [Microdochium trichocladiopsis]KAH7038350.1 hypothetical protein B0I36DRAFT_359926 [Microdochium trichocladiopsis]
MVALSSNRVAEAWLSASSLLTAASADCLSRSSRTLGGYSASTPVTESSSSPSSFCVVTLTTCSGTTFTVTGTVTTSQTPITQAILETSLSICTAPTTTATVNSELSETQTEVITEVAVSTSVTVTTITTASKSTVAAPSDFVPIRDSAPGACTTATTTVTTSTGAPGETTTITSVQVDQSTTVPQATVTTMSTSTITQPVTELSTSVTVSASTTYIYTATTTSYAACATHNLMNAYRHATGNGGAAFIVYTDPDQGAQFERVEGLTRGAIECCEVSVSNPNTWGFYWVYSTNACIRVFNPIICPKANLGAQLQPHVGPYSPNYIFGNGNCGRINDVVIG